MKIAEEGLHLRLCALRVCCASFAVGYQGMELAVVEFQRVG